MKMLIILVFLLPWVANPTIDSDKNRWKPYYLDVSPLKAVDEWHLPFSVANRKDLKQIKIISIFGDHRDSYLSGHIHTAIDVNPVNLKDKLIAVLALANGVVCSVHLVENQRTVVVKHRLNDGKIMFTSYKHLKEVYVKQGQQVNHNTKLARLFTTAESQKYGGDYHHLHLEIRKSFDDYGCASWLTMNNQQLNQRFYNPLSFLKQKLPLKYD
jgi:murein DD-endopeptidase MepM/ murein hydrolase activator NlpD